MGSVGGKKHHQHSSKDDDIAEDDDDDDDLDAGSIGGLKKLKSLAKMTKNSAKNEALNQLKAADHNSANASRSASQMKAILAATSQN